MSFYKSIPLGTVVSFRYGSPTANDKTPMVLVFAFNYLNELHGLNIRYLDPVHLAQLQWIFKTPPQQKISTNPFRQEIANEAQQAKDKAQQEAIKRKQEQLSQQKGVIVKPQEGNPFGVSTFGPSKAQVQPAYEGMPGVEGPSVTVNPPQPTQEMTRLRGVMNTAPNKQGYILSSPYRFYHSYFKSIMPNVYKRASVYRRYKHPYIQNLRIVHSSISQRHTEPVQQSSPSISQVKKQTMSPQQKGALRRKANEILSKYEIKSMSPQQKSALRRKANQILSKYEIK